jgi:hypothetical protein
MNAPIVCRRRRPRPPFTTPRRFRPGQMVCSVPSLDVDGTLLCDHGVVIRCRWNHPQTLPGWSYLVRLHPATQSHWAAGKTEWYPELLLQALEG